MSRRRAPRPSPSARTTQLDRGSPRAGTAVRGNAGGANRSIDTRIVALVAAFLLLVVVGFGGIVLSGGLSGGTPSTASATLSNGSTSLPAGETVVQIAGGRRIDVTPDRLASMLEAKDFTLLNVKTPYIGEIEGTDLYIPYDQLASRTTELPTDHSAKIVVYCRSGNESGIAAQTLVSMGYANVYNLAGGMNAWISSGRSIVQRART